MSVVIAEEDLGHIARGAAVLGTGGGGDPYIGALLARSAVREHGPVRLEELTSIPDDALVLIVAMMGAPTVMVEKLPGFAEILAAVTALGTRIGKAVTHIACAEIGGVNSTIPIAAAAALGLPLLDGDGMGRAFPELQMVMPTLYGVAVSPLAFADEKGNTGVLNTRDNHWSERIARVLCVEMGCSIMIAGFAMSGAVARSALVSGSVSRAREIGLTLDAARRDSQDPVARVIDLLGGRELFDGKVIDVERRTVTGFARGIATIQGNGTTLTVYFQNEHLVAECDGQVLVTSPDLIMMLENETGEPITTERLRYGQRVRVIAAPADERWHSTAGLALVGPRVFGYDLEPHRFDGTVRPAAVAVL